LLPIGIGHGVVDVTLTERMGVLNAALALWSRGDERALIIRERVMSAGPGSYTSKPMGPKRVGRARRGERPPPTIVATQAGIATSSMQGGWLARERDVALEGGMGVGVRRVAEGRAARGHASLLLEERIERGW
jgi:hypothetical protein